jgi:alpha-1,2-mannosyltransferase
VLAWVLLLFLAALLVIQHRRLAGARARVFLLLPYLVLMIIASPLTFFHHIIYIYPGILVISWILLHRAKREAILLLLLLLGTALIASIDFPIYYEALSIEAELLRSLNLYALLVLFGLGLLLPELRVVQGLENADPAAPS